MNILFINDLIVGGGVENVLYNVISYLETKKEYQISLLSLTDQKEDFEQRYSHKIKYLSYEPKWFQEKEAKRFSPYWFIKRSVTFLYRSFIIQKKYDVVIAIKEGHVMKLGNKIRANKKYAWVHVDYRYLYWTQYCFQSKKDELLCMSQYDNVVCVSNATKDSVCQVVGNPENLVVKMNPLNINNILEKSNTPVPQLDEYMDMKKSYNDFNFCR